MGLHGRRLVQLAMACLLWAWPVLSSRADEGQEYPWVLLSAENDSRDAEVQEQDEVQSLNMVGVINQKETLFGHHLIWKKVRIRDLLPLHAPFCEMHFDAVKPFSLSAGDKVVLTEYLKRGGFILFFIDAYPYTEEQFWKVREWPLMDFLRQELPASDPDFKTGKATDAYPIFKIHYKTETADQIRHELTGNPNTPNRTLLYYKGQLCCFVMGQYSWLENGQWAQMTRPFPRNFSLELKSYQLIVNVYTYSMMK